MYCSTQTKRIHYNLNLTTFKKCKEEKEIRTMYSRAEGKAQERRKSYCIVDGYG